MHKKLRFEMTYEEADIIANFLALSGEKNLIELSRRLGAQHDACVRSDRLIQLVLEERPTSRRE